MKENATQEYVPYNEILSDESLGIFFAELNPEDKIFHEFHLELHDFRSYQVTRLYNEETVVLRFSENYMQKIFESWLEYQQQKNDAPENKGDNE
jgi:hypothetical protein